MTVGFFISASLLGLGLELGFLGFKGFEEEEGRWCLLAETMVVGVG